MTDINELEDEELKKITGGNDDTPDNPKGLHPGDSVRFYNYECFAWMWGTFKYYKNGKYEIEWNDTVIIIGDQSYTVHANCFAISEEYIE